MFPLKSHGEKGQKPSTPPSALPSPGHVHASAVELIAGEMETTAHEQMIQNIPYRKKISPFLALGDVKVSSSTAIFSPSMLSPLQIL